MTSGDSCAAMVAVAVIVVAVIVMAVVRVRRGRHAAQSPRWPKKVMNMRRQE